MSDRSWFAEPVELEGTIDMLGADSPEVWAAVRAAQRGEPDEQLRRERAIAGWAILFGLAVGFSAGLLVMLAVVVIL